MHGLRVKKNMQFQLASWNSSNLDITVYDFAVWIIQRRESNFKHKAEGQNACCTTS